MGLILFETIKLIHLVPSCKAYTTKVKFTVKKFLIKNNFKTKKFSNGFIGHKSCANNVVSILNQNKRK